MKITEKLIKIENHKDMINILGHHDKLLKLIEEQFDSDIMVRGNQIKIKGSAEEVETVATVFQELIKLIEAGREINAANIGKTIDLVKEDVYPSELTKEAIVVHQGKAIAPQTKGQKKYLEEISKNTVTFSIGPAGTGKTYLAMAWAVRALKLKIISRVILTRPAVEAGEKLGFLPGTLYEKVDPYLRPLYDALYDMMEVEKFQAYLERGTIEVAPLAYMRGRTLNNALIILDEAQNTSPEQMKMFLTRLGFGSKMIITGDVTQVDLPSSGGSGLIKVQNILVGVKGISFVHLGAKDVVRHKLVQNIVEAYKEYES
ncbi:MAG: PhoH family protein [Actinobacteria bacterium]|nr:MAG: PhoH family protein [Actinomycetota bacterium]